MLVSVSESDCREDGKKIFSEMKDENEDGNKEGEKDWFLEAFLVGYRKEKDRRQRLKSAKEEREKKAMHRKKMEEEWRREEREKVENRMMGELISVKKTLEKVREEGKKLRLEIEELRKEEGLVKWIAELIKRMGKENVVNDYQVRNSGTIDELKVNEIRDIKEEENDEKIVK